MYKIMKRIFKPDKIKYHIINLFMITLIVFILFFEQAYGELYVAHPGSSFERIVRPTFTGEDILSNYTGYYGGVSGIETFELIIIILLLISSIATLAFSTFVIFKDKKLKLKSQLIIGSTLFAVVTIYWITFLDTAPSLLSYLFVVILFYLSSLIFLLSNFVYKFIKKFQLDYLEDKYQKKHYTVSWTEKIVNIELKKEKTYFSTKKLKRATNKLQKKGIEFNIKEVN